MRGVLVDMFDLQNVPTWEVPYSVDLGGSRVPLLSMGTRSQQHPVSTVRGSNTLSLLFQHQVNHMLLLKTLCLKGEAQTCRRVKK